MKEQFNDPLLLAGKVLTILLQGFLALGGAVLTLMIPVVIIFQDDITSEFAEEFADAAATFPTMPMVGLFLLAIAACAMAFFFFGKLRAIIGTVAERDPFAPENANRLNAMAWLMLAIQVIAIPIGGLALLVGKWTNEVGTEDVTVDAGIDLTGILIVVILFILARVFKHGAAMREDLEGTV